MHGYWMAILMTMVMVLVACGGSQAAVAKQPTPRPAPAGTVSPTPAPTFTPFNPAPVISTLVAARTNDDWLLVADMADVLLKSEPQNERYQDARAEALMMMGDKAMGEGDVREAARRWEMARSVKAHPVIEERLKALTPTATPSVTPVPLPTSPPTVRVKFTGSYNPRIALVGQPVTAIFTVSNLSGRPLNGFTMEVDGPRDKFIVLDGGPNGPRLTDRRWAISRMVAAGDSTSVTIVFYPREPGDHQLSFALDGVGGQGIIDDRGSEARIGFTLAVLP